MKRGLYAIRAVKDSAFIVEYHGGYMVFLKRQFAYWLLDYKVEAWREDE